MRSTCRLRSNRQFYLKELAPLTQDSLSSSRNTYQILGYPWLTTFEPIIHWKDATLDKKCQPVVVSSINPETQVLATMTEEEWEEINQEEDTPYAILRKTTMALELAQKAMDKTKKTFKQMVPEEYRRHA